MDAPWVTSGVLEVLRRGWLEAERAVVPGISKRDQHRGPALEVTQVVERDVLWPTDDLRATADDHAGVRVDCVTQVSVIIACDFLCSVVSRVLTLCSLDHRLTQLLVESGA